MKKLIRIQLLFIIIFFISIFILPIYAYANPEGEAEAPSEETTQESESAGQPPDENESGPACSLENAQPQGTTTSTGLCSDDSIDITPYNRT